MIHEERRNGVGLMNAMMDIQLFCQIFDGIIRRLLQIYANVPNILSFFMIFSCI